MKNQIISILLCLIPLSAQSLQWQEMMPGVWKTVYGKPDTYNLLFAADVKPNQAAIEKMAKTEISLAMDKIRASNI